jgi:hypothetical protein
MDEGFQLFRRGEISRHKLFGILRSETHFPEGRNGRATIWESDSDFSFRNIAMRKRAAIEAAYQDAIAGREFEVVGE